MGARIALIQGHPDACAPHLCHALAAAYRDGAQAAGHEVREIDIARIDFPLLKSAHDWKESALPDGLIPAQETIAWCNHLVLLFPLWLGDMPAVVKGFLEQIARPGFAFTAEGGNPFGRKGLQGRSARVIVTMGMPALIYRYYFRAHSVKSLERNILGFVGMAPVRETLIGSVESLGQAGHARWMEKMRTLGGQAA